jgi:hypothetical protein
MMREPLRPMAFDQGRAGLAAEARAERQASLHALHVLEYALCAPAPRRHRIAVDALGQTLKTQLHAGDETIGLLDEIVLSEPSYADAVAHVRRDLIDLSIALASLREQLEADQEICVHPGDVRDRLATLTRRFRQHRANEADLIYKATGIDVNEELDSHSPTRDDR